MAIKTSTLAEGIGLIEARGTFSGGDETIALRQAVAGFVEQDYQKMIIDLTNTTYINSTALGILVAAHTTYTKKGWKVKICGVNNNVNNIFVITRLSLVFDVFETQKQAVESFAESTPV